tara:strand:+ start:520 stop:1500 length:981 start_codon:yes stop_codon:yes gene_type:complete
METGYYISQKDYDKIINYAEAAYESMKAEIGGMAICYQDKDGDWVVTDPVILKQKVTGSTCDLDKDELANYYCRAAKKHAKKEFRFCWWHSHHTMGVFWSGTDIKGINEYSDGDMSFALVVNLKRENLFRISMWKPVIMHEDTKLEILNEKKAKLPKKIMDEVEDLCESPSIATYIPGQWNKNKHQGNLWADDVEELNSYNASFGIRSSYGYGNWAEQKINHGITGEYPQENILEYCLEKIEYWIDEISEGRMDFDQYLREVKKENNDLYAMNSPYTFVEISRNEIDENFEMSDPFMYIRIDGKAIESKPIDIDKIVKGKTNGART